MAAKDCPEGYTPCQGCNDVVGVTPEIGYKLIPAWQVLDPQAQDSTINKGYKKIKCDECEDSGITGCVSESYYNDIL
jgi:hypothetical protein